MLVLPGQTAFLVVISGGRVLARGRLFGWLLARSLCPAALLAGALLAVPLAGWVFWPVVGGVVVLWLRWLVVGWCVVANVCSVVAADCTGGPSRLKGAFGVGFADRFATLDP